MLDAIAVLGVPSPVTAVADLPSGEDFQVVRPLGQPQLWKDWRMAFASVALPEGRAGSASVQVWGAWLTAQRRWAAAREGRRRSPFAAKSEAQHAFRRHPERAGRFPRPGSRHGCRRA